MTPKDPSQPASSTPTPEPQVAHSEPSATPAEATPAAPAPGSISMPAAGQDAPEAPAQTASTNARVTSAPPAAGQSPAPVAAAKPSGKMLPLAIVGIVVVLGIAGALIYNKYLPQAKKGTYTNPAKVSSSPSVAAPATTATLSLNPASGSYTSGQTFTVEVHEDSGSTSVNAVQANLTYPTDKLDFVAVDATGSAFSVAAEATGSAGVIKIARGNIKPLTSNQLVAKIQFKAKTAGSAAIAFSTSSGIISSTANNNVLKSSAGGTYTIK